MASINKPYLLRDATPSRLQELHEATLRLLELLATHKLEEDLLQKGIEALATLIGARYGAIGILDEAGQLRQFVHAGITPEEAKCIGHLPEGHGLLGAVVRENHVLRLDDMSKDPRSVGFPPNHPPMKSLLAAPISHQGQVYGRVYLSEKTTGEPFNESDEILTKHYADALALVLTYHRGQTEHGRAEQTLREIAQALSTTSGWEFFPNLVLSISKLLKVDYAFVGEFKPGQPDTIQTIAFCNHGRIVDNIDYRLAPNTPCGSVECQAVCHFPEGARKFFPEDDLIYRYGVESFIGHPLLDYGGSVLGLLVVMHEKPTEKDHIQSLLQLCASRAAAELERRHSNQAQQESEERFRSTFSQAAVGIAHVAPDGRWLRVNQKLCDIVGYTEQELLQRTFQDITHPDDLDADLEYVRQMLAGAIQMYSMEKRYFRKDGAIIWIYLTVSLVRDEQGNPKYFISVVEDISARKQAEEAQRRGEENLRALAENANDGILVNSGGRHVFANQRLADMLGYSNEQLQATGIKDLVHPDEYEKVLGRFQERMAGKTVPFQYETVFVSKSGVAIPVEISATKTVWHGQPAGLVFVRDISARKQSEAQMLKLSSVVEQTADSVVITGRDGVIQYVNPAYEAITGYTWEDAVGKKPNIVKSGRHDKEFYKRLWNIILRGEVFRDRLINRRKDGSLFHEEKTITPLKDGRGRVTHFVSTGKDITGRVQTEGLLARLGRILDNSSNEVYVFCADSLRFIQVNQGARQNLGYTLEELKALTPLDLKPEFTKQEFEALIAPLRRGEQDTMTFETVHKRKDGSLYPVEVRLQLSRNETPPVFFTIIQDITERMRAMEALRASATSLANAQRIAHLGNWDWNIVTNELRWSDEIYRIFGLTPQQFDATYEASLNSVHPDDRQSVIDAVNKALNEKAPYSIYHRIVRPDGTERIVHEQAEVTFDENDKPIRMVGTVQDVTEFQRAQERLNYLAHYDTLTGLPNRLLLQDRLNQAMFEADRRDRVVAVMFLDLDRFKIINDTLGHDVGDALLKSVAERLTTCVRAGDTISRLGGDEFTVILANVAHVDDVARVAQKIIDSFAPPFNIAGRELFMSTSIGITLYPFDDDKLDSLLRNADAAMYHAKEMGRNTFQFYTAELNRRTAKRLQLETALRHALERNELLLHYQPQVNLKTGKIIGAEALLRWQHSEMGLIPPLDFIPLAEETGLIIPIGEWALRTACRQAQAWRRAGFPRFQVAVNLSGRQLQHRDLAKLVKKVLKETGLNPRHLDLELTESLLMHNTGETLAAMEELHTHGVAFSMDDFGTGYSSLSYLKRFPIDTLKIDQSFVRDIPTDPDDAAIAQAIIAMAHSLGIQVIAEGVETAKQLAFLRAHRCDGMQGYYFSKPVPAEAMTKLLQEDRCLPQRKTAPRGKTNPRKQRSAPGTAR